MALLVLFFLPLNSVASPLLWQIKNPNTGGQAWLFGSIHLGQKDMYPLPKVVEQAFSEAEILVLEVDVSLSTPDEMSNLIWRLGSYSTATTLEKQLNPETWKRLQALTEREGLSIEQFQVMQPWLASVQLVLYQAQAAGYKEEFGIDSHFFSQAHGKKRIYPLETLRQQFSLFAALSDREQQALLEQTLNDFDQGEAFLSSLVAYWKTGNQTKLSNLVLDPVKEHPETQRLYEMLFTDRNKAMAAKIADLVSQGKTIFVVVGAGHLLGDESIQVYLDAIHKLPALLVSK
ncbi:MAG: TraB/GumN family protein [Cellvibrionaceae bacterium]